MWKTLAGVLCIGLLAGCGQQASSPTVQKTVETVKPTTPAPKPTPPPTQQDTDKTDLGTYSSQALPVLDRIKQNLADIQKLALLAGSDPSVIYTAEYQNDVDVVCNNLMQNVYSIQDITNPDNNQQVNDVQGVIGDAMNDLQFVAINFPIGVKQADPNLISDCTQHIISANNNFGKGADLLAQYNAQNGVKN